ncbi:hypothetical protein BV22DRAFT_423941 [Leucogyrophana mollusca]|uniref:Uncharacterized protein n=1 Tax=Leucogyrophana mollusca TaxID=85980 RepID=A0ACB8BIL6_9AGAM|nr:hypothetical protein BV22DRAFT_423941 [Leucogyrophana mollusca]
MSHTSPPPPPTQQQQSPYVGNASAPAAQPVPATFASIMNAYPAPPVIREDSQSRPGSQDGIVNGSAAARVGQRE